MYGVVSASGRRIIPYLNYILAVLGAVAAGGIAFAVYRLFFTRGYSGRGRL